MQIECKLKRDGGTHVELGDVTYHFKPQSDGAHVADVPDQAHIDVLLGITEGYQQYLPQGTQLGITEEDSQSSTALPRARTRKNATTPPVEGQPAADDQGE